MAIKLSNIVVDGRMDINYDIKDKSVTAFMGRSGSGKTLLSCVISSLTDYNGKVTCNGKVGVVFQNPDEQFFSNTVEKEIGFGLNFAHKDKKAIHQKIVDALMMVDLPYEYLDRKINSLSSGEKRKVAIASVLADNPKVLILDEPTVGLDAKSVSSLVRILNLIKSRYEKTIIVFSKDADFIHQIADEVVIIDNGKIVLSGNKYDVFTKDIEKYGLRKPKIIQFESMVLESKHIKLLYRDDINDLMKDVYRHVK